jgi:acetyl esterase/lipase
MAPTPHLEIPYPPPPNVAKHARHKLDLYLPSDSTEPKGLIVFVHGGAWRTSSSQDDTLSDLPTLFPHDYALAIPNYRLSDQSGEKDLDFKHPCHVLDVKAAVEWLAADGAGGRVSEQARRNVWLVGHSAGAVSHPWYMLRLVSSACWLLTRLWVGD